MKHLFKKLKEFKRNICKHEFRYFKEDDGTGLERISLISVKCTKCGRIASADILYKPQESLDLYGGE